MVPLGVARPIGYHQDPSHTENTDALPLRAFKDGPARFEPSSLMRRDALCSKYSAGQS